MLTLLFVVFMVALLIGFDVGFSMILAALLGILFKPDAAVDLTMMPISSWPASTPTRWCKYRCSSWRAS